MSTPLMGDRLRRFCDWFADRPLVIEMWLLDRTLGPMMPETEADRIRKMRMARLRRAFPEADVDGTGPLRPAKRRIWRHPADDL